MINRKRTLLITVVLVFVFTACNLSFFSKSGTETPPKPPTLTPGDTPPPDATPVVLDSSALYRPPFSEYIPINVRLPEKTAYDYALPLNLSEVTGLEDLNLTDKQLSLLAQNGFVVAAPTPGQYQEFYQIYESIRYPDDMTAFATTDAVFHVYHLIFDKMLRDLERDSFIPDIETLTKALLTTSAQQYQSLLGTPLEDAALRNVAYFGVAATLLGIGCTCS